MIDDELNPIVKILLEIESDPYFQDAAKNQKLENLICSIIDTQIPDDRYWHLMETIANFLHYKSIKKL